jgi:hypothetical protein
MTRWGSTPRWEVLEDWMIETEITRFTAHDLAASLGIPMGEASSLINSHLGAQRSPKSRTLFVIKREGRTRNAVWSAGEKTADIRVLNGTLFGDIRVKIQQAYRPDLERLATINPRAARKVEKTLEGVVDGALVVMANALDGAVIDE